MSGVLALVGGEEFTDGCTFDADLVASSGATRCSSLPTGAAYEHPQRLVDAAIDWFEAARVKAAGLDLLARRDAFDPELVDAHPSRPVPLSRRRIADASALRAQGHARLGCA